jgi:phosphatidylinositol-3-phosphatase
VNCDCDPGDNGTQQGLNPMLIRAGDDELKLLVRAITDSRAWEEGNDAIVIVWDENDYSVAPTTNQVPLIVVTSHQRAHGVASARFYTAFSLLRTLEAGFGLPCLSAPGPCGPGAHAGVPRPGSALSCARRVPSAACARGR